MTSLLKSSAFKLAVLALCTFAIGSSASDEERIEIRCANGDVYFISPGECMVGYCDEAGGLLEEDSSDFPILIEYIDEGGRVHTVNPKDL